MDETPHSRRPGRLAARLTAAALAAAALAAPAGASAATAGVQDRVLAYTAAPSEANRLSVGFDYQTGYFVLSDAGAPVTAGPGCKATSANTVACAQSLVGRLALDLGDGDDSATSHLVLTPTAIAGGAGNDTLTGALPDESLDGGDGDDRLTGGASSDRLDSGAGIDIFRAGAGADQLLARDQVA